MPPVPVGAGPAAPTGHAAFAPLMISVSVSRAQYLEGFSIMEEVLMIIWRSIICVISASSQIWASSQIISVWRVSSSFWGNIIMVRILFLSWTPHHGTLSSLVVVYHGTFNENCLLLSVSSETE
jgi:hypothetical protein